MRFASFGSAVAVQRQFDLCRARRWLLTNILGVFAVVLLLPDGESLVTPENGFQCLIDDPVAGAVDELAVALKVREHGPAQADSSLLLGVLRLFGYDR